MRTICKRLSEVDWIIEAVVENLEIKRALLKKVEAVRKPGTIITTNTSGLPVAKIAEGFSEDFRRSWFGTHFFNPPRYMRLLEIIPTPDSDPAAMEAVAHFCDVHLGKGVVHAKDTPNFIANRIGTFSVLNVMRLMQEMDLSIEDVDALTGRAVGWPKSATFRTIDLVGLDILGHVVRNMEKAGGPENPQPSPFLISFSRCWSASGWATRPRAASTRKLKRGGKEGGEATRAGLEDAGVSAAPKAEVPCPGHGEERRDQPERVCACCWA